jgi:hypothetical protein
MGRFLSMLFSPNSKYDISRIGVGFSKDRVTREFGRPQSITSGSDMGEQWIYSVPFRIFVSIEFSKDGLVTHTYRRCE